MGKKLSLKMPLEILEIKQRVNAFGGYINGIWNDNDYALKSTTMIAKMANNEQVWSLVNNTKSQLKDLVEYGRQKLNLDTDIVKFAAKFLQLLLQISHESPHKSNVIVFVHSQGAIIADLAL